MRMLYKMNDVDLKKKALFIGDFTMYFGEAKYELKDHIEKLQKNSTMSSKLVNSVRKIPGMTGFTIDSFLAGLETAQSTDVFSFKVNGETLDKLLNDKKDIELEIYMNPLYFITKAAYYQYFPGFRNKHDSVEVIAKKEEDAWLKHFENNLSKYYPRNKWVRSVMED